MRFLVIGCGSIGERHIKNLIELSCEVVACDIDDKTIRRIKKEYSIPVFKDLSKALNKPFDGVIVSVPTKYHVKTAKTIMEKGYNIFIEKPISNDLEGIDELIKIAEEKNLVNFVACNMRFHLCIRKIKDIINSKRLGKVFSARLEYGHYLPNWRPGKDYREVYSSHEKEGGGIILDAIHEFDYIKWLLENSVVEVFCDSDKLSNLDIDAEDTAEILFKLDSGVFVEIHLDYLQVEKRRSCEIICEKGTIFWESEGKQPEKAKIRLFSKEKEEIIFDNKIDLNSMYVDEMKHFINCICGKEKPIKTIKDGKEVATNAKKRNELSSGRRDFHPARTPLIKPRGTKSRIE